MVLLLIHGDVIVELLASGLIIVLVFPALALWLWWRPPRAPILPAAAFLLLGSASWLAFMTTESGYYAPAFAFSFPWGLLLLLVSAFFEFNPGGGVFLPGVVLNAILIYRAGVEEKRRRGRLP